MRSAFSNIVNDVRDRGLVVLSTFTSSSSFHYCLLDEGHILYKFRDIDQDLADNEKTVNIKI
jgi:hypothetical protein